MSIINQYFLLHILILNSFAMHFTFQLKKFVFISFYIHNPLNILILKFYYLFNENQYKAKLVYEFILVVFKFINVFLTDFT